MECGVLTVFTLSQNGAKTEELTQLPLTSENQKQRLVSAKMAEKI